ncbi:MULTISPECIES: AAA family ATPase [Rhizobium]|uniref:Putative ATPase n=1 Tax=Rhizobium paranaense TaxID=1650438 RepID=A0A7W8XXQ5_9HYPH|nr:MULTISPECIES: AAA family ATPase [Rhizobium]MBB5577462.1 putative ATPase [Rhizobium paranaense]PST62677.1 ATPase [Rhizobium sp. SEMIA4064]
MDRFVIISGCSGGGKSTLLEELRRRGHQVVEEPGRRIVIEELERGGSALPWLDAPAFARRAVGMSISDRSSAASAPGLVFFDRGLIDAAAALHHLTGEADLAVLGQSHRYNRHVFLTPPWPEIYVADRERRHDLSAAIAEYDRLSSIYPSLGYEVHILPKVSIEKRANIVLSVLDGA